MYELTKLRVFSTYICMKLWFQCLYHVMKTIVSAPYASLILSFVVARVTVSLHLSSFWWIVIAIYKIDTLIKFRVFPITLIWYAWGYATDPPRTYMNRRVGVDENTTFWSDMHEAMPLILRERTWIGGLVSTKIRLFIQCLISWRKTRHGT